LKLLITAFSLLSFASQASPFELSGTFTFSKKVTKFSASVVEPVYAFTSAGRERLAVLKKDGYKCKVMPRQTYRCSKFDDSFTPRASSIERINEEYSWETLEFIGAQGQPYLSSDAPALAMYEIEGKVKFQGVNYDRYFYQISKYSDRELHKLILRGESNHEFLVHSAERLGRIKYFTNQEKKRFFKFLYEGEFTLF
jgi:hypothetical protein